MSHRPTYSTDLWSTLSQLDRVCAARVRHLGCPHCRGRLHVANYPRKPRGVARAMLGDDYTARWSFCCADCRRRTTPPSVRFLGRKVYVAALVVLFGNAAVGGTDTAAARALVRAASEASGIPARTLERWRTWWTSSVPATRWWATLAPRFAPPVDAAALPAALLARASAVDTSTRLTTVLGWTRALSTRTCSHWPMLGGDTHEMV